MFSLHTSIECILIEILSIPRVRIMSLNLTGAKREFIVSIENVQQFVRLQVQDILRDQMMPQEPVQAVAPLSSLHADLPLRQAFFFYGDLKTTALIPDLTVPYFSFSGEEKAQNTKQFLKSQSIILGRIFTAMIQPGVPRNF